MKLKENLTTDLKSKMSTEFGKTGGGGTDRMMVQNGFINSLGENKDKNKKEQVIKRKIKKGVSDKIVGTPKLKTPIGKMYSSIGGESNESTGVGSAGGFEAVKPASNTVSNLQQVNTQEQVNTQVKPTPPKVISNKKPVGVQKPKLDTSNWEQSSLDSLNFYNKQNNYFNNIPKYEESGVYPHFPKPPLGIKQDYSNLKQKTLKNKDGVERHVGVYMNPKPVGVQKPIEQPPVVPTPVIPPPVAVPKVNTKFKIQKTKFGAPIQYQWNNTTKQYYPITGIPKDTPQSDITTIPFVNEMKKYGGWLDNYQKKGQVNINAPLFSVTKKEMDEMKQTSFKAPKLTMFSDKAPKPIKNNESIEDLMEGKNTPTNPSLWSRAKAAAKSKYKVYPSAYANGFAAKWYKKHGGGWKKKSSNESKEFNEASSPAQQAAIAINMKKKGIKPKNENVNEDLRNWFKEKWVDVSKKVDGKHPPCGRKDADGKAYPKCRPSKKVSSETPKVASSYDKDEKKAMTQQKRRAEKNNPKVGKDNKPTMTKFDNKKVETKEATGASSAGSYLTTAAWAKSTKKKDWRGKSKTQIPGGKFVQVKEKCKKFPYCNQGDIKSLNIFENETFKKVIKNISKKHGISENVIKSILSYEYYNNK